MRQARENVALPLEPFRAAAREQREVEQLDRDVTFEAAVAAPGKPHRAHAALTEQVLERVAADRLALQRRLALPIQRAAVEEGLTFDLGLLREEARELIRHVGIFV